MAEEIKPITQPANEFRDLVRIVDKDITGNVKVLIALERVRGVGFMMSNAVCSVLGINPHDKVGNLSVKDVEKIEDCVRNPAKYNIPKWLFNRRKDFETGLDIHVVSSDLKLQKEFDIRQLKKIKAYRGVRHTMGSKKVRGQRTRTTGRKGSTLGVQRKKKGAPEAGKPAAAPAKGKK